MNEKQNPLNESEKMSAPDAESGEQATHNSPRVPGERAPDAPDTELNVLWPSALSPDEATPATDAREEKTEAAGACEEARRETLPESRRSFLVGAAAALAGFGAWRWLKTSAADADSIPWPLRRAHEFNERLARGYFSTSRLAPTFPRHLARMPRTNGDIGLDVEDFAPAEWRLEVVSLMDGAKDEIAPSLSLTLADIKTLPRVEEVTELKCIEGWSQVVHWAGARFADFAATYQLATRSGEPLDVENKAADLVRYVSLETPDGVYYVGLDIESALHPQTLLCYEMDGQPLTPAHGAPLRLYVPVKYGIKSIKRIGRITFTDQRPFDYWADRGYDWYSGH